MNTLAQLRSRLFPEAPRILDRVDPGPAHQRNKTRKLLSVCWGCKKVRGLSGEAFKCCANCNCACYCSRACQSADWERHEEECPKLDRLKSLSKSLRRELVSLQLAVRTEDWGTQRLWMVLCRPTGRGFRYLIASPPGYEEALRKSYRLPTDEHFFKLSDGGHTVFVGLSGRVIIFKTPTRTSDRERRKRSLPIYSLLS
jgi:hypothetical protein